MYLGEVDNAMRSMILPLTHAETAGHIGLLYGPCGVELRCERHFAVRADYLLQSGYGATASITPDGVYDVSPLPPA